MKAFRANMVTPGTDLRMTLDDSIDHRLCQGSLHNGLSLSRDGEGYDSHTYKLVTPGVRDSGYGLHHMVLVSRRDSFMPVITEEAMWRQLKSKRYTTPVIRPWCQWLYDKISGDRYTLQKARCFACQCGQLLLSSDGLDKLVVEGLRRGMLRIEEEAHDA